MDNLTTDNILKYNQKIQENSLYGFFNVCAELDTKILDNNYFEELTNKIINLHYESNDLILLQMIIEVQHKIIKLQDDILKKLGVINDR